MRIVTTLTVLLILCSSITGLHAQRKLDIPISIVSKSIRLDSLLQLISRQTGFKFSFTTKVIKTKTLVPVAHRNLSAKKWLGAIQEQFKLEHTVVGDHIILKETIKKAAAVSSINTRPNSSQKKVITKSVPTAKLNSFSNPKLSIATPSNTSPGILLDKPDSTVKADPVKINPGNELIKDTMPSTITAIVPIINLEDTTPRVNTQPKGKKSKIKVPVQNVKRLDIGIRGIGLGFERKLADYFTVDLSISIGGNYQVSDKARYNISLYDRGAHFSVNPRWYFNGIKDVAKPNNGSYIGSELKYVYDLTLVDFYGSVFQLNLHYGIQKSISPRWQVNGFIGPELLILQRGPYKELYPSFGLKLSYIFKQKK